ncbi:superinfection immunity protein [Sulfitobacter pseudonitzschiae]|uniref:Superinfection immunity protein n=1 Tax=Pseudosulfitobacter pseudonitzschiae TaxID=1402135 RepID=A0A9Q2NR65_9RHOB|nr:superinfection immunity protein [Pseudosulfitobacter pseudonitzschiae]MBM2299037.1 superinfection immunity protein [Pseudosulfitobacter pseudonitzschiae]MBM2303945.1 superinfection immunity protein [Pseudosulfitobacter pseudonitzschiae]MBM2313726.1 superinfection immunity protein [Pseudosulfitobacter pseudonitzschiae]MBM2318641.1 superinfection immunity protein [Pseudosulfitobacter pseudonitzschiae]
MTGELRTLNTLRAASSIAASMLVLDAGPASAQGLHQDDMFALKLVVLVVIFWILYVVPTVIAFHRKHPNRWAILVVNVVFGATGLGWLGSLVWACSAVHISPNGSNGGESGLNLFVNDPTRVPRETPEETAPDPNVGPSADPLERMMKLLALREAGAIDDNEFAVLKRRVLS